MDKDSLAARLAGTADNEGWLKILAEHFRAGGIYFGHGTDNADDEAYWLLRHLQQWSDEAWAGAADSSLATAAASLAWQRVEDRIPLAYLLGTAWFAGLPFFVDSRVLVPRSPFAEMIENRFAPWLALEPGDAVLEVGTGSGCIAIATALHCAAVRVDATDISVAALEVAARNVALHDVGDRVQLIAANLFPSVASRYRVIISNPPYVPERDYADLPAEYRHEPRGGLVDGVTGLQTTWALLQQAPNYLTDDGVLFIEVGNEAEALADSVPGLELTWVEFEHGGTGVFLVDCVTLRQYLKSHSVPQSQ